MMHSAPQASVAVALAVIFAACATGPAESDNTGVDGGDQQVELADSDIIPVEDSPQMGGEDAWVTAVVFADFQCPFCARVAATLDEVREHYDDETLRVVFKHYPLETHDAALPLAKAAEAAGHQGNFWDMHDALFDATSQVRRIDDPEALAIELAEELELDVAQFRRDLESQEVARRIEADRQLADDLGIDSVPVVFVNGGYIPGARSPEVYRAAIENVYQILQEGVDRGEITRNDVYRSSVESLYSHTAPDEAPEQPTEPPVADVPVDTDAPATGDIADALVHAAVFANLGEDHSLQLIDRLHRLAGGDELRIAYYHLPGDDDPSTILAHRALESADSGAQTRELTEWLVEHAPHWRDDPELLETYLDEQQIEPVGDEQLADAFSNHRQLAGEHGIYGTPTTFVNGIRRVGVPDDLDEFDDLVEEQISLARRVREIMGYTGLELYKEMIEGNRHHER